MILLQPHLNPRRSETWLVALEQPPHRDAMLLALNSHDAGTCTQPGGPGMPESTVFGLNDARVLEGA